MYVDNETSTFGLFFVSRKKKLAEDGVTGEWTLD